MSSVGKETDLDEAMSAAASTVGASDVDVDQVKDGKEGTRKEQAVQAFKSRDVEQSRAAHAKPVEKHGSDAGAYIQAIVFGGLDGCVTVFAAVAGIQGASYSSEVVLVLGFAKLLGDSISMGLAEYLSEAAEVERIAQEKAREVWEYDNNPEGEVQEMVELYTQKGFKEEEAATIMSLMKNHKKFFINHMLVQELGLMVPPDDEPEPWKKGLATLASFIFFGIIPLISYVALNSVSWPHFDPVFLISCIMTGVSLFILGAVKSKFAEQHWFASGCYVVATGGTAAAVAYGVGVLLDSFISSDCG